MSTGKRSVPKPPNILLLFPDQHRGDWMPRTNSKLNDAHANLPLRMPNVEQIMRQGVTFTKAISPSPLCAPARACLASGLRYDKCGVPSNHADYPLTQRTFYTVLQECGYRVGGVGKFDLHKNTQDWGLSGWKSDLAVLGFTEGIDNAGKIDAIVSGKDKPKDPYMKYLHDNGLADIHVQDMERRKPHDSFPTDLPDEAYCDNWLTQNGIQLLRHFPQDQPWFLAVNFTGPHHPWDITRSMKERWSQVDFPPPLESSQDNQESIAIRQNYAAMLENIDRNIGLLIDEVRNRGELDRTVIVYTSDHGEMLGDFNMYGKCRPEQPSIHIPLVMSGPGIPHDTVSDALVELQDMAATFVEMAGGTMKEASQSLSLLPLLRGEKSTHRDFAVSRLGRNHHNRNPWEIITDGTYKFIVEEGIEDRLHDLSSDPTEVVNIASENPDLVQYFRKRLRIE